MAAIATAIGAALAPEIPSLIQLIANLVHPAAAAAEAKYGSGTGAVKYADVLGSVMDSLNKAALAGTISKQLPQDETIKIIVQSVLSSMKVAGQLDGVITPVPVGSQAITLKAGQSVTISVV